jgi:hypothetical protein
VENALRHAVVSLAGELDREPDPELVRAVGLPSRLDALWIWRHLSHRVWHGVVERVWTAPAADLTEVMPAKPYRRRMDSVAA